MLLLRIDMALPRYRDMKLISQRIGFICEDCVENECHVSMKYSFYVNLRQELFKCMMHLYNNFPLLNDTCEKAESVLRSTAGSYRVFTHTFFFHHPALAGAHIVVVVLNKLLKETVFWVGVGRIGVRTHWTILVLSL